jgi:preprotein translocase subunit SecE
MAERTNPFVFLQQVRSEVSKVVWPSRRETAITTAMVFAFVILASVFFFVADMLMAWGVARVLGIGA